MSLYGYNRRTTPNLERIAAEGALFDYAYSNSTWTGPSTLSFLTSLQHSVLGGLRNARNMAPEGGADHCAASAAGRIPDGLFHLESQRRHDERS